MHFRNEIILALVVVGSGGCILAYPSEKYDACADKKCIPTSWAKRYGNGSPMHAAALAEDSAGHTIVGGTFSQTLKLGKTTLTGPADGKEAGFVAWLNDSGNPYWAVDFSDVGIHGSAVKSIAVGKTDSIFAAGFVNEEDPELTTGTIVRYDVSYTDGVPTIRRGNEVFLRSSQPGAAALNTEIIAISIDPMDQNAGVYAVGRIKTSEALPCVAGADGEPGIFVAKFDATMNCVWAKRFAGDDPTPTAITANRSATNGVWVTGYFKGMLGGGGSAPLDTAGTTDMFLFNLDRSNGAILNSMYQQHRASDTTSWIKPTAIDVDDKDDETQDQEYDVLVVGNLSGTTSLTQGVEFNQEVGFVGKFKQSGSLDSTRWLVSRSSTQPVTITAISRVDIAGESDVLYLAGTFFDGLAISLPNLQSELSTSAGLHPFFIRIPSGLKNTMDIPDFHYFEGMGESATPSHNWLVHPGKTGVTMLGEWQREVDLSIPEKFENAPLTPIDSSQDGFDIVVGHFDDSTL